MVFGQQTSPRSWKVSRLQIALSLILAAAGFLAVTQVRNEMLIRRALRVPSGRLEELGFLLREQERTRTSVELQILQLRDQLRAYEQGASQGRVRLEALTQQLEQMRLLAGLTAVAGPGVLIDLDDSPRPLRPGDDPNTVILHYTDLQGITNELWASGAEAVAINGERIVISTGLTCVGTTILCNVKRIAAPYHIIAIGDPGALLTSVRRRDGVLETLRAFGFPVKVTAAPRLVAPAYRGGFRFTFAHPLDATP